MRGGGGEKHYIYQQKQKILRNYMVLSVPASAFDVGKLEGKAIIFIYIIYMYRVSSCSRENLMSLLQ
jgi:hypothetical protein